METARPHNSRRNRLENTRSRSNPGAIPYSQMIDDSNTSTQHDVLTDSSATGYTCLRGNNRMFADNHVMRDLDQVVDFDAPTNEGSSEGGAVDRGVGTYLHIVLQFHDSHLWNLNPLLTLPRISKPIAPYNDSGVQHHPVSNPTSVADNDVRMQHTILSNLNSLSYKYTRIKNTPCPDMRSSTYKDMREYCHTHF
jgi:hypothetical protein